MIKYRYVLSQYTQRGRKLSLCVSGSWGFSPPKPPKRKGACMAIGDNQSLTNEREKRLSVLVDKLDQANLDERNEDDMIVKVLRNMIREPSRMDSLHVLRLLINYRKELQKFGISESEFRDIFKTFIVQLQDKQRAYFENELFNEA